MVGLNYPIGDKVNNLIDLIQEELGRLKLAINETGSNVDLFDEIQEISEDVFELDTGKIFESLITKLTLLENELFY